jgi:hypothetical protein
LQVRGRGGKAAIESARCRQPGSDLSNSVPRIALGRVTCVCGSLRLDESWDATVLIGLHHGLHRSRLVLVGTLDISGMLVASGRRDLLDRPCDIHAVGGVGRVGRGTDGLVRRRGTKPTGLAGSAWGALCGHDGLHSQSGPSRRPAIEQYQVQSPALPARALRLLNRPASDWPTLPAAVYNAFSTARVDARLGQCRSTKNGRPAVGSQGK